MRRCDEAEKGKEIKIRPEVRLFRSKRRRRVPRFTCLESNNHDEQEIERLPFCIRPNVMKKVRIELNNIIRRRTNIQVFETRSCEVTGNFS